MDHVINTRQKHEQHDHILDIGRIFYDAGVFWGESSGGYSAEGVAGTFKKIHASQQEKNHFKESQGQIDHE